jgi:nucleoside-diphosphate-sugar epimerase
MRIAVTGATGFIGGVLARRFARLGHTVFAFGRRPAVMAPPYLTNYRQWELPSALTQAPAADVVIHCAAKVGDWGEAADYDRINVGGTKAVLEAFGNAACFVHVSSGSVYSNDQPIRHLSEDAAVGSRLYTAYAESKAKAEQLISGSGRGVVILRPHIVYGPGDPTLLPRLFAARRFGWLPVPGNGSSYLSVTHVLNFVHAVECVLERSVTNGIFNIADPEPMRVDDIFRTFLQRNGVPVRIVHIPRSLAWAAAVASEWLWRTAGKQHAPRLTRYVVTHVAGGHTLDLRRAIETLGYAPAHNIYSGSFAGESE